MSVVTVLGDGSWGTALALSLHSSGHDVRLWGAFPDYIEQMQKTRENESYLKGFTLPDDLELHSDAEDALHDTSAVIIAIPTQFLAMTMTELCEIVPSGVPVCSVAKGIDQETKKRPTEILTKLFAGENPVAALSGPSHAEEVAKKLPATVTIACDDEAVAKELQEILMTKTLRIYTSNDVVGVELGGALKNVIAIAAGIGDGLELGDNAKSALLTRGLAEMSRLGVALGANERTFMGLSGMGDLITTCVSPYGRNLAVGRKIGKGETLEEILESMTMVAEGVWTARVACELAKSKNVSMPIAESVCAVLFGGINPRDAVLALMSRDAKSERE